MSNEIVKMFNDNPVRIIDKDGDFWFIAKDVASILGYRDASNLARRLDEDERGTQKMSTPSAEQEMTIINESGLYHAIIKSNKKEAQNFRKWVTKDILPSIRKTGGYIMPGLSQVAVANIVSQIESTFNVLTHDNQVLREENEYLRQYEPKSNFGDDSEITGRAKWMIRRGAYVSGRGRKAKCLKPTGSGCIQLNLFDDYLPVKNIVESMKLLGVNEINLSLV